MKSKPSKNIFKDLGFTAEEADNLRIRSALMIEITEHIRQAELTQKAAAQLLGVAQPRISDIIRGRIEVFSIDTLIAMLSRLGVKTSIRVGSKRVA